MFVCITYINKALDYAKTKEKSMTAGLFKNRPRQKEACNITLTDHFTRSEQELAHKVVAYALDIILLRLMQHSHFLAMESSVTLPLSPLSPYVCDAWLRLVIPWSRLAIPWSRLAIPWLC
jgi:hypothetical protein